VTRVGLIARADNRGIGFQTWEFFRHMQPDKTLLVLLNDPKWPEDVGRYRGDHIYPVTLVGKARHYETDERQVRKFLEDLDVVFAVETLYDWRIADWARQMGVRTVVQANPEFWNHHHDHNRPLPDQVVWPTDWMLDHEEIPNGPVIPVPCVERPNTAADPDDDVLRVLHVAGHAAAGDRNGTSDFTEMLPSLRAAPIVVTIIGQDGVLPEIRKVAPGVTLDLRPDGVLDRWEMYRNQHLVVLPRRYGGLCLPALEAMASGCAVLMPDCSPNEMWPGPRIRARRGRMHRAPFGFIQTYGVHPLEMAQAVDRFAKPEHRAKHMADAKAWADDNCWVDLGPLVYEPLLEGE
jgi:glycosyltransferase involved in cell wall biosynthesis